MQASRLWEPLNFFFPTLLRMRDFRIDMAGIIFGNIIILYTELGYPNWRYQEVPGGTGPKHNFTYSNCAAL